MAFGLREWQVTPGNWNRLNEILGLLGSQEIPAATVSASGVLSRDTDVTSSTYGEIVLNYDTDQFQENPAGTLNLQHLDMSGSTIVSDNQLEIISTTSPQLELSYDGSNNATFAVGSGGDLTINASGGDISFGNENLSTTGTLNAGVATLATGSTIGTLTLADASITDSGGVVRFDGLTVKYTEDNVADPPLDTQLDTIFGTPAALGAGYIGILDDNSADTDVYICFTNDTSWWYIKGTKAVISAIDSAEKRKSISGIPLLIPGVTPNVAKDQEWRQETGWCYSGIEVSG